MAITAAMAASSVKLWFIVSCKQNSLDAVLEGVAKIILNYDEDERALKRKCTNDGD